MEIQVRIPTIELEQLLKIPTIHPLFGYQKLLHTILFYQASDAQVVEDYLKNKWGVENILDSSTLSNHGTGKPHHSTAKFGTGINFDGLTYGKSISSRISTLPGSRVSLAVWVYPESEDFIIFNSDGLPVPASISLQKQRPY